MKRLVIPLPIVSILSITCTKWTFEPVKAFTVPAPERLVTTTTGKEVFLESLDKKGTLNIASKDRTKLLNEMISDSFQVPAEKWEEFGKDDSGSNGSSRSKSLEKPGSSSSFDLVAPGTWKVIYAPHMTTMARLAGGSFDVQYDLLPDGTMQSHAYYDFPIVGSGYLSVSGTYGSVDDRVCRVDFDKVWLKRLENQVVVNSEGREGPYASLEDVPNGVLKDVINNIGRLSFREEFSVFPVSFLDDDLIVFDFELLGVRICATKTAVVM